MAAVTQGKAHIFGLAGTIANATVVSFNWTKSPALNEQTVNENGIVIERRYDDRTQTADITIRITSEYELPSIGDTLAYKSNSEDAETTLFSIEEIGSSQSAGSHTEVSLSLKTNEGITLT